MMSFISMEESFLVAVLRLLERRALIGFLLVEHLLYFLFGAEHLVHLTNLNKNQKLIVFMSSDLSLFCMYWGAIETMRSI